MSAIYQVQYIGSVPTVAAQSNVLMEGFTEVDADAWAEARTTMEAPPVAEVLFASISDRQFFEALASDPYNLITEEEAEEAVATGAIPGVMQAVIDVLPADQRFKTRMLLRGATTFERGNPLVEVFGASQGMNATAINDFWQFAGSL